VQAKLGDQAAMKLLFQYVVGRPAAVVDPDTLDQQEVELYARNPPVGALREVMHGRMAADVACDLLRGVLPCLAQRDADLIAEAMLSPVPPTDEDDFDFEDDCEDEDEEGEEDEEPVAAATAGRGVPLTNGDPGADGCQSRTKAPPHDGNGRAKPHRNGRAKSGGR
jgi:hypothetical protein